MNPISSSVYLMVAAKSPRLHVLDAVELNDLVGSLSGGFGLLCVVHLGDRGAEHGREAVLLEVLRKLLLHLGDFGGGPFELGRLVAVGEVSLSGLGESEGLGCEWYLLVL